MSHTPLPQRLEEAISRQTGAPECKEGKTSYEVFNWVAKPITKGLRCLSIGRSHGRVTIAEIVRQQIPFSLLVVLLK